MPDPTWLVTESPWQPARNQVWETRFTLGNGYLGIRGHPDEPFDAGPSLVGTYVAGVFNPHDETNQVMPIQPPMLGNSPKVVRLTSMSTTANCLVIGGKIAKY